MNVLCFYYRWHCIWKGDILKHKHLWLLAKSSTLGLYEESVSFICGMIGTYHRRLAFT
jgi:hypothetical protein